MRILIAEDSIASSKALRPLFGPQKRARQTYSSRAPAVPAGQLTIWCAPRNRGGRRRHAQECACNGLNLDDQPECTATILDTIGIALLNRGCQQEGSKLIEQALQIRRKFFGANHPATAASLNSFARVQRERGEYDDAEATARDALRINRAVYTADGVPVATSLLELGFVQLLQGLYGAAAQSATEGLRILDKAGLTATDPNTTRLMDVRGRAEAGQRKLKAAAGTYRALLALDKTQLRTKRHPKYATHLANYALVKEALGRRKQAARDYQNAIDLYGRSLNRPCHPNLIDAHANLGSLLRTPKASARDLKQAGFHFAAALRLSRQVRGDSHPLVGNDHANLGRWQYDSGDWEAAKNSFATALRIYRQSVRHAGLPADHFFIAESLTWLGRLLVEAGSARGARQAEPLLEKAVLIWPAQRGPGTPGEGIASACLGRALFLQGKHPARACQLLCAGQAILVAQPHDPDLARRLKTWIKEQGCTC